MGVLHIPGSASASAGGSSVGGLESASASNSNQKKFPRHGCHRKSERKKLSTEPKRHNSIKRMNPFEGFLLDLQLQLVPQRLGLTDCDGCCWGEGEREMGRLQK